MGVAAKSLIYGCTKVLKPHILSNLTLGYNTQFTT